MDTDIISAIDNILAVFDAKPVPVIGRPSVEYSETIPTRENTGYNAVQLAAERLNRFGENLGVDQIMSLENWDLVR